MLECKEHHGLPLYMYPLAKTAPGRDDTRQSMFTPWTPSVPVRPPVTTAPCHTPLVPNSLARPPHTWSKDEVRVWLEWCAGEFSIGPVSQDKFDMNGKALELLKRADFMERDPSSGDVLFNALQKLIGKHDVSPPCSFPSYPHIGQPPGVTTAFNHHTPCPTLTPHSVHAEHTNGIILFAKSPSSTGVTPTLNTENPQPSFVPILPGPVTSHSSPAPQSIHIPESMLSPAPTTDTDSGPEEAAQEGEEDMAYNEDIDSHQRHSPESRMTRDMIPDLNMPNIKKSDGDCRLLWEFIHQLLQESRYRDYVSWERQEELVFRIVNPTGLAELWGYQKNRTNMTYEKLSRALRYYYKMNIIKKVSGKRLTYQFLQHPRNIKKGQRGARPHSARVVRQESNITSPQPISDDRHNEASSPPMRDFHPDERQTLMSHKPMLEQQALSNTHIVSFDSYDKDCDLQLIGDRLVPPPPEEEDQDDHTVPYVKQEVPVQEEPEDLSMKSFAARRSVDDSNYACVKEEHREENGHIKLENSS